MYLRFRQKVDLIQMNCERLFQDQPFSNVEQRLELIKIGGPVRHQILIVSRPKMN